MPPKGMTTKVGKDLRGGWTYKNLIEKVSRFRGLEERQGKYRVDIILCHMIEGN